MKLLEREMLDVQHNGPIADSSHSYLIHKNHICISSQEANIASFCLRYLTFECFNKNLAEKEIKDFLLKGYYAFQDYAVAHWIDHLAPTVSGALQKGSSDSYNLSEYVRAFLQQHTVRLAVRVEDLDFVKTIEAWAYLARDRKSIEEHLDLEHGIRRIRQVLEEFVGHLSLDDCRRDSLAWFYGSDWFKCPRPWCDWFHEGFDKKAARDRHVRQHERPFCCTFGGCPAATLGYQSESELKRHLHDSHLTADDGGWKFPLPKKKNDVDIWQAAAKGDLETVRKLVEGGIDLNKTSRPKGGLTALNLAVRNMDSDMVNFLLAKGADVNFRGSPGARQETPLFLAVSLGSEIMTRLLMEEGADLESKDRNARTPLSWAAEKGQEALVRLLLEKGADPTSKDKSGRTALSWAAEMGHEALVSLLLEKGADPKSKGKSGQTLLWWAAEKSNDALVSLLLEKGADPKSKDKSGQTLLWWAAEKSNDALVSLLLEKGADPKSKDKSGQTLLWWAAEKGNQALMSLLLEKGADPESQDGLWQRTPLSWAAEKGHEALVKLLLEMKADPESKDKFGQTPLWWAAEKGHETLVELLLEKGADPEFKDNFGQTLLWGAAEKGHEALVRLLLEKGADPESQDRFGQRTPLWAAAEKGHEALVRLLLENGADPESKDIFGETLLSWAAEKGDEALVRLLLEKGADPDSKDVNGQTPLWWAVEKGHKAVVRLLVEKGPKIESS